MHVHNDDLYKALATISTIFDYAALKLNAVRLIKAFPD